MFSVKFPVYVHDSDKNLDNYIFLHELKISKLYERCGEWIQFNYPTTFCQKLLALSGRLLSFILGHLLNLI